MAEKHTHEAKGRRKVEDGPGRPLVMSGAGVDAELLHFTIDSVAAQPGGVNKNVQFSWWVEEPGEHGGTRVTLLQDSMAVVADATDDEILEAIRERKKRRSLELSYTRPNPEANQGLVGHEE